LNLNSFLGHKNSVREMDREPRFLRSARPFVPMAVHPTSSEDDNAMLQMMCDLMLDEIQTQIDRVQKEAVSN